MGKKSHPNQILSIDDLSDKQIQFLLSDVKKNYNKSIKLLPVSRRKTWALLFLEPSTRTRASFELALTNLGHKPMVFDFKGSSLEKGETLFDTVTNLHAIGVYGFVVRQRDPKALEVFRGTDFKIINAGDGPNEHPTQSLLDAATLKLKFKDLKGLSLGLFGDLKNSRVAHSWMKLAPKIGVKLKFVSPESLRPANVKVSEWSSSMSFLKECDVLMALRIQKERFDGIAESEKSSAQMASNYCLKSDSLGPKQFFMAPGPVYWGQELGEDMKEHSRSLVLMQAQVGELLRRQLISALSVY